MPSKHSDSDLVSACTAGESWAWDALVDRYKRLVYSIPVRANLTQDDAEDVFQIVFTRLCEHIRSIRDPQALAKWLITTAKHVSYDVVRQPRGEVTETDLSTTLAPDQRWLLDSHPDEDRWIRQAWVRDALERLGGRCRELLRLLYYDPNEPSYEQVSRRLKMPVGSVGPTRARCLGKLRDVLAAVSGEK